MQPLQVKAAHGVSRSFTELCKLFKSQLVALQTFQIATRGFQGISTANGRNLMTVQGIPKSSKECKGLKKDSKEFQRNPNQFVLISPPKLKKMIVCLMCWRVAAVSFRQ